MLIVIFVGQLEKKMQTMESQTEEAKKDKDQLQEKYTALMEGEIA